jgi:hypothetical protein
MADQVAGGGLNWHFSGGMSGTGLQSASSFQPNVPQGYQPSGAGINGIPNELPTVNGESAGNYAKSMPMQSMLRSVTGFGGTPVMNV